MREVVKVLGSLPWLVVPAVLLAGCASIVGGTTQTLSVSTISAGKEVAGAQCKLANDKGTWFVVTPGTVSVHRSYDALNVTCADAGYAPSIVASASATKGMVFGNILFGGLIGAAVDMSDGAAYDYPALITVPLTATVPSAVPGQAEAPSRVAPATS